MRVFGRVLVGSCLAALCLAGCTRADAGAKPDAEPPELLATVAIGPATTLRGLQAYLEAIAPSAGEGLGDRALRREIAGAVGASSLDGIDLSSWMYLLVVATGDEPVVGLLAKVADAKVLASHAGGSSQVKRGWAVLGGKPVIDRVGAYALAVLANRPAPRAPGATLYLPHLLARYRSEIAAARKQLADAVSQPVAGGQTMQTMASLADGVFAALAEVKQVVVTVEASPDLVALDLALAPRQSSRLARFIALQRPSDFALLGKLPATAPSVSVVAGRLDSGPYRDGLLELVGRFYGPGLGQDLPAAMAALLKTATGEIAAAIGLGAGMSGVQLFGVTDAAAANQAIAHLMDLFRPACTIEAMQMSTTLKADPNPPAHDGVTLHGYDVTYDLSKVEPEQRKVMELMIPSGGTRSRMAAFDKLVTFVAGPNAAAEAELAIDAARGKAARFVPPPEIAELVTGARARKESIVMTFDVGAMLAAIAGGPPRGGPPAPFLFSLGFADRRAHVRIAAPIASVRAAVLAGKP